MKGRDTFEAFNCGSLKLTRLTVSFAELAWSKHPVFEGVELKHIVTSTQTNGQFSYHLVRIAPNKKIGLHTHEKQLETHEVVSGEGVCKNDHMELNYQPGTISIFPISVEHEVIAGEHGLLLFAKFFPALC